MSYKSYRFSNILRIAIPLGVPLMLSVNGFILYTQDQAPINELAFVPFIMFLGGAWFIFQIPFRLRYVEATEEGLLVNSFGKYQTIDYKDIDWVTKFDFGSPFFTTVKYRDTATGESKKIAYALEKRDQKMWGDDRMTAYIKHQIIRHNPLYKSDNNPSQLKNLLILILYFLPFVLTAFYVMGGFSIV